MSRVRRPQRDSHAVLFFFRCSGACHRRSGPLRSRPGRCSHRCRRRRMSPNVWRPSPSAPCGSTDPVTIRWNERQVPFIEAETDDDAAFALGLVHAHLRLGQMAALRMLARGRLSEMIGPFGVDIDRGLRILGHGRTAAKIERSMDPAAQRWVRRFVDGVNHYRTARSSCHTSSAFSACGANPARSRTCWPWGVSPGPTSTGWSGTNCSPCARGPAGVNSGRV